MRNEDVCPQCGTTRQINPKLQLLASHCGHYFCRSCEQSIFKDNPSAKCPSSGCPEKIAHSDLTVKIFDDGTVHREVLIRKMISRTFNKTLADFSGDLRAYNDYLEMVEDFTFNLTQKIDVDKTEERIRKYKEENKELIRRNASRATRERHQRLQQLQSATAEHDQKRLELALAKRNSEIRKRNQQQALIDDLTTSTAPAASVIAKHREATKVAPVLGKVLQQGQQSHFGAIPVGQSGKKFSYKKVKRDLMGPVPPDTPALNTFAKFAGIEETNVMEAGGYSVEFATRRALEDAFACLFAH